MAAPRDIESDTWRVATQDRTKDYQPGITRSLVVKIQLTDKMKEALGAMNSTGILHNYHVPLSASLSGDQTVGSDGPETSCDKPLATSPTLLQQYHTLGGCQLSSSLRSRAGSIRPVSALNMAANGAYRHCSIHATGCQHGRPGATFDANKPINEMMDGFTASISHLKIASERTYTLLKLPQELLLAIFDFAYPCKPDFNFVVPRECRRRDMVGRQRNRTNYTDRPFTQPKVCDFLVSKKFFASAARVYVENQTWNDSSSTHEGFNVNILGSFGIAPCFVRSLTTELAKLRQYGSMMSMTANLKTVTAVVSMEDFAVLHPRMPWEDDLDDEDFSRLVGNIDFIRRLCEFRAVPSRCRYADRPEKRTRWTTNVGKLGTFLRLLVTRSATKTVAVPPIETHSDLSIRQQSQTPDSIIETGTGHPPSAPVSTITNVRVPLYPGSAVAFGTVIYDNQFPLLHPTRVNYLSGFADEEKKVVKSYLTMQWQLRQKTAEIVRLVQDSIPGIKMKGADGRPRQQDKKVQKPFVFTAGERKVDVSFRLRLQDFPTDRDEVKKFICSNTDQVAGWVSYLQARAPRKSRKESK